MDQVKPEQYLYGVVSPQTLVRLETQEVQAMDAPSCEAKVLLPASRVH